MRAQLVGGYDASMAKTLHRRGIGQVVWAGTRADLDRLDSLVTRQIEKVGIPPTVVVMAEAADETTERSAATISEALGDTPGADIREITWGPSAKDVGPLWLSVRRVTIPRTNEPVPPPIELVVRHDDQAWVAATTELIRGELRRGVPRWGWVRSWWAVPIFAPFGVAAVFPLARRWAADNISSQALLSVVIGGFLSAFLVLLARVVYPSLEIYGDTRSAPIGQRVFNSVMLVLGVASVVVGVLALV
jgi:hypothetical protein